MSGNIPAIGILSCSFIAAIAAFFLVFIFLLEQTDPSFYSESLQYHLYEVSEKSCHEEIKTTLDSYFREWIREHNSSFLRNFLLPGCIFLINILLVVFSFFLITRNRLSISYLRLSLGFVICLLVCIMSCLLPVQLSTPSDVLYYDSTQLKTELTDLAGFEKSNIVNSIVDNFLQYVYKRQKYTDLLCNILSAQVILFEWIAFIFSLVFVINYAGPTNFRRENGR